MTIRTVTVLTVAALAVACDTEEDTTDTAPSLDAPVSGVMTSYLASGDLIDDFTISGATVACADCLYAFEGTLEAVNVRASQDGLVFRVVDLGRHEGGYDIGLVYIDSPNTRDPFFWGYAYDDGSVTRVSNADAVLYDGASYAYEATFYR